ncbi:hypothetical protein H3009_gp29 [Bacillus phage Harambe]|uniref:Uncharacterized protein n=2 Tax=Harambevirus TaxID=2842721 RepID=A0A1W6JSC8_9CAUD|nr:hypothetical protein H3009_gp29 [Bacillus phage Harambe]YP_009910205.1 hypothetical protein H3010_gp26 [Bacillus phage BeachBum]ARM70178.1 hypothetical protein HARAMBE_29 [Bacillus phage Harambe]ARQ95207.1 hypothetical protein BEACHBUM_26 [Bacillus phage BeachBum]
MNKYKRLAERINVRWNGSKCSTGWAHDMIDAITILMMKEQNK